MLYSCTGSTFGGRGGRSRFRVVSISRWEMVPVEGFRCTAHPHVGPAGAVTLHERVVAQVKVTRCVSFCSVRLTNSSGYASIAFRNEFPSSHVADT
jgi:hypothetical protein